MQWPNCLKRKKLSPVRLELSRHLSEPALDYLCEKLEIGMSQVFYLKSPLDLSFVYALGEKCSSRAELFYNKLIPQKSPDISEHEANPADFKEGYTSQLPL